MSLQKKCLQLKSEIYQLKKKAHSQKETTPLPDHKILDGIVFGNNSSTEEYRYYTTKSDKLTRFDEGEKENDDQNVLTTPHESLVFNRKNIKQEIREIKRMENIPEGYSKTFLNKIKQSLRETQEIPVPVRKQHSPENTMLKRQLLSNSKTIKKSYIEKDDPEIIQNLAKENFSQTVNKIYNEKKGFGNSKIKELIQKKREIAQ